jgi:putative membrane protein
MRFLLRLGVTAVALWAAVYFVAGISYEGPWYGLLVVALIFGLVNAVIRPILAAMTCPLMLLTLGLFVFVLNAIMLWLTSIFSRMAGFDFHVAGFVPALIGALIVGVTSAILSIFIPDDGRSDGD